MLEMRDGSFGNIKPIQDLLSELTLMPHTELANIRSMHIGTESELQALRSAPLSRRMSPVETTSSELEELKERIADLEMRVKPGMVHIYQPAAIAETLNALKGGKL